MTLNKLYACRIQIALGDLLHDSEFTLVVKDCQQKLYQK